MRRLLVIGLLLTGVTLVAGVPAGRMPECATGGVVELELARTEARAVEILGGCDEAGLDEVRDSLRLDDLLFVPAYVITLSYWSVVGTRYLDWSTTMRCRLVLAAAPVAVIAGIFDLVENQHLGTVVDAGGASAAVADAFAASVAKWVLVTYSLVVAVVVLVRSVRAVRRTGRVQDVVAGEPG